MVEFKTEKQLFLAINKEFQAQEKVPYLPRIILKVEKAISDKETGARQLANVILEDPALTARVLKLANSLFYSVGGRKIIAVTDAIVVLGFETIRNLVLGLSVMELMTNFDDTGSFKSTWIHTLRGAVCAKALAKAAGSNQAEETFVAGLLRDIGKLILEQFFPEHYASVSKLVEAKGMSRTAAEIIVFQASHITVGAHLSKLWGFPDVLIKAINHHEFDIIHHEFPTYYSVIDRFVVMGNCLSNAINKSKENRLNTNILRMQTYVDNTWQVDKQTFNVITTQLNKHVSEMSKVLDIAIEEHEQEADQASIPTPEPEQTAPVTNQDARLNFLLSTSEFSAESIDIPSFFKETAPLLHDVLELSSVLVLFYSKGTNNLVAKFGYGSDVAKFQRRIDINLNSKDDVSARCYLENKPFIVTMKNMHEFTRISPGSLFMSLKTTNVMALPMKLNEKTIGTYIVARSNQASNFGPEEKRLLNSYTHSFISVLSRSLPSKQSKRVSQ